MTADGRVPLHLHYGKRRHCNLDLAAPWLTLSGPRFPVPAWFTAQREPLSATNGNRCVFGPTLSSNIRREDGQH